MSSSTKTLNKRRSITLAEVDLVNSNAFKQTQQNLEKQNLRLDKSHTESMLLHNREYAELKRFLYSIRAVNSDGEPGVSSDNGSISGTGKSVLRAVTAPGKESLALVPEDAPKKQPTRPNTVTELPSNQRKSRQRSVSDSALGSATGDFGKQGVKSEPTSPRKGSFSAGDNRLPRLMLPTSSPIPEDQDQPTWKQSRRRSETLHDVKSAPRPPATNKDGRKSSTITLEFNMKSDAGGRRLSRSTSLESQLTVPPRRHSSSPIPEQNNNGYQQKQLSSSMPLPYKGNNGLSYTVPSVNFLNPTGTHSDPSSSSSCRSASPTPKMGVPPRRHSVPNPISSTSIRKSVELSEGFAMDTKAYDPSIHADTTGRRYSGSEDGSSSGPGSGRSHLPLKQAAAYKVSHAKSMEVMVASQKQILQRRKTLSQLNTRLLTAGECIEIQNKRRDRIHTSTSGEEGGPKGGAWSKEPFFVNRPGNKPTRKNSTSSIKEL